MRVKWSQRWSFAARWSSSAERPAVGIVTRPILRLEQTPWMVNALHTRRAGGEQEGGEMARTPLLGKVQDAVSVVAEAAERKLPVEQVLEERTTRRALLKRAGAVGVAAAGASTMAKAARAATSATAPRIAVVGAGLAGLTCAYRLKQAGYVAQVYEAHPTRVGGRCWSYSPLRSPYPFADGQVAEHGGELIDQGHTAMRQLANELGFTLDNLLQAQPNGTEDFYYVNGGPYLYSQLVVDL